MASSKRQPNKRAASLLRDAVRSKIVPIPLRELLVELRALDKQKGSPGNAISSLTAAEAIHGVAKGKSFRVALVERCAPVVCSAEPVCRDRGRFAPTHCATNYFAKPDHLESGAPIYVGAETRVLMPGPSGMISLPARYVLAPYEAITASHDPIEGFRETPGYPQSLQERDYAGQKSEQQKVRIGADNFLPDLLISDNEDALVGPPVIDSRGFVLGGNGRTMIAKLAAHREGSWKLYEDALARELSCSLCYGLEDAPGSGLFLARELTGEYDPVRISSQLNAAITQLQSREAAALSLAQQFTPKILQLLAEAAERGSTFYQGAKLIQTPLLERLRSAGIVTPQNQEAWTKRGEPFSLNRGSIDRLRDAVIALLLGDVLAFREAPDALVKLYEYISPELLLLGRTDPENRNGYNFTPDVRAISRELSYALDRPLGELYTRYKQPPLPEMEDEAQLRALFSGDPVRVAFLWWLLTKQEKKKKSGKAQFSSPLWLRPAQARTALASYRQQIPKQAIVGAPVLFSMSEEELIAEGLDPQSLRARIGIAPEAAIEEAGGARAWLTSRIMAQLIQEGGRVPTVPEPITAPPVASPEPVSPPPRSKAPPAPPPRPAAPPAPAPEPQEELGDGPFYYALLERPYLAGVTQPEGETVILDFEKPARLREDPDTQIFAVVRYEDQLTPRVTADRDLGLLSPAELRELVTTADEDEEPWKQPRKAVTDSIVIESLSDLALDAAKGHDASPSGKEIARRVERYREKLSPLSDEALLKAQHEATRYGSASSWENNPIYRRAYYEELEARGYETSSKLGAALREKKREAYASEEGPIYYGLLARPYLAGSTQPPGDTLIAQFFDPYAPSIPRAKRIPDSTASVFAIVAYDKPIEQQLFRGAWSLGRLSASQVEAMTAPGTPGLRLAEPAEEQRAGALLPPVSEELAGLYPRPESEIKRARPFGETRPSVDAQQDFAEYIKILRAELPATYWGKTQAGEDVSIALESKGKGRIGARIEVYTKAGDVDAEEREFLTTEDLAEWLASRGVFSLLFSEARSRISKEREAKAAAEGPEEAFSKAEEDYMYASLKIGTLRRWGYKTARYRKIAERERDKLPEKRLPRLTRYVNAAADRYWHGTSELGPKPSYSQVVADSDRAMLKTIREGIEGDRGMEPPGETLLEEAPPGGWREEDLVPADLQTVSPEAQRFALEFGTRIDSRASELTHHRVDPSRVVVTWELIRGPLRYPFQVGDLVVVYEGVRKGEHQYAHARITKINKDRALFLLAFRGTEEAPQWVPFSFVWPDDASNTFEGQWVSRRFATVNSADELEEAIRSYHHYQRLRGVRDNDEIGSRLTVLELAIPLARDAASELLEELPINTRLEEPGTWSKWNGKLAHVQGSDSRQRDRSAGGAINAAFFDPRLLARIYIVRYALSPNGLEMKAPQELLGLPIKIEGRTGALVGGARWKEGRYRGTISSREEIYRVRVSLKKLGNAEQRALLDYLKRSHFLEAFQEMTKSAAERLILVESYSDLSNADRFEVDSMLREAYGEIVERYSLHDAFWRSTPGLYRKHIFARQGGERVKWIVERPREALTRQSPEERAEPRVPPQFKRLTDLSRLGKGTASKLELIGISSPEKLAAVLARTSSKLQAIKGISPAMVSTWKEELRV